MHWRKARLDWGYAVGELVIVTAGVLIALAIDQWNTDRIERAEEVMVIDGLLSDLDFDAERIERGLGFLPEKEASLWRVYEVLVSQDSEIDDPEGFLGDIIEGSRYGWFQFDETRTTFDELLSSGRFGLIRDAALRQQISEHYAGNAEMRSRIVARSTPYPNISYQFAPRVEEFELDTERLVLTADELALRARSLLTPELVMAEINFSDFMYDAHISLESARDEMSTMLRNYRTTL